MQDCGTGKLAYFRNPQSAIRNPQSKRGSSYDGAAFARARDAHLVAILGNRSATHLDALFRQPLGDLIIGNRVVGIFGLDHLLDLELEHTRRHIFARIALHAFGEEAPQLVDALRRVDILAVDDARYSAQVHADVFGNVFEHHRAQVLDALVEKFLLALDDGLTDAVDRLPPMLDVLQQINRRAKALFDIVARLFGGVFRLHHLAVGAVDAQVRHALVFKADDVAVADLFDSDFGDDRLRLFGGILAPRLRVELLDDLHLGDHLFERHAQSLGKLRQLVRLQALEMVAHHARCQRIAHAADVELNQQRLAHVARRNPH